jgi:hypothetical protein
MGFVRKKTGIQGQIDAAAMNADAQEAATKQAAMAQQRALMDSARAAAASTSQIAARAAAESKAADAASQPLATADVQLDDPTGQDGVAARRTRRASFGRGYSSGVNL